MPPEIRRHRTTNEWGKLLASKKIQTTAATGAAAIVGALLLPTGTATATAAGTEYTAIGRATSVYGAEMRAELSVSSRTVTAAGERIVYRLRVPFSEFTRPGLYPLTAMRATVDLSAIADDVADLDSVFDDLETSPLPDLLVRRDGASIVFEAEHTADVREFVANFAIDFARGGDGDLGVDATVAMRGGENRWDYGASVAVGVPVIAAQPAPIIRKTVDRTRVTTANPAVRYTIEVTRPKGSTATTFSLSDDLADTIAEAGGAIPADFRVERGSAAPAQDGLPAGAFTVENGVLNGRGAYDSEGRFALSFSTVHLGSADGVLRNTACAEAPARTIGAAGTPDFVEVPGGRACAAAPEVTIDRVPPKPDPRPEPEPKPDPRPEPEPTPDPDPRPRPAPHPAPDSAKPATPAVDGAGRSESLATTGGAAAGAATVIAGALALTGAGALLLRRARSRRGA